MLVILLQGFGVKVEDGERSLKRDEECRCWLHGPGAYAY